MAIRVTSTVSGSVHRKRRRKSASSGFSPSSSSGSTGSSAMPHFGQVPGPIWRISGCIGQVYSVPGGRPASAPAPARASDNAAARPRTWPGTWRCKSGSCVRHRRHAANPASPSCRRPDPIIGQPIMPACMPRAICMFSCMVCMCSAIAFCRSSSSSPWRCGRAAPCIFLTLSCIFSRLLGLGGRGLQPPAPCCGWWASSANTEVAANASEAAIAVIASPLARAGLFQPVCSAI
jgi:hypothetical protein